MKLRTVAVLALALGVLAVVVAGCGGDDSNDASGSGDTVATESTVDEDTTVSDDTDTDIDLGDLSGECLEFAGIGAKIAEAMGGASGGSADIGKTSELFDELVSKAPDEIKDDLEVLSEGIGKMAEAFEGVDFASGATPSADQLAKIQEVMSGLNSAELTAAGENIEAWATENCTS